MQTAISGTIKEPIALTTLRINEQCSLEVRCHLLFDDKSGPPPRKHIATGECFTAMAETAPKKKRGRAGWWSTQGKPQISPLRCAPVEMTNLLWTHPFHSPGKRLYSLATK